MCYQPPVCCVLLARSFASHPSDHHTHPKRLPSNVCLVTELPPLTTSLFLLPQDLHARLIPGLHCISSDCLPVLREIGRSFIPPTANLRPAPNKLWSTRRTDRVYHSLNHTLSYLLPAARRRPRFGHNSTYTRPSGHLYPQTTSYSSTLRPSCHELPVRPVSRTTTHRQAPAIHSFGPVVPHAGDFPVAFIRRSFSVHIAPFTTAFTPSRLPGSSGPITCRPLRETIGLKIRRPHK